MIAELPLRAPPLSRRTLVAGGTLLVLLFVLTAAYRSQAAYDSHHGPPGRPPPPPPPGGPEFEHHAEGPVNTESLLLDRQQCDAAFPGLYADIEKMEKLRQGRKITFSEIEDRGVTGSFASVRAMIYDNRLYILDAQAGINTRIQATLHSLHLAIATSPHALPNSEFTFTTFDSAAPSATTWSFTRNDSDPAAANTWLMPDFGLWAWPEPKVGSYEEALLKAEAAEQHHSGARGPPYSLDGKHDRLVWRGAGMGLPLRESLFAAVRGRAWADVRELHWDDRASLQRDLLSMPQHCAYKWLLHVEGMSYSGRLKYLQACHSVVVAHRLVWQQHHHPLMVAAGPEQNFVQVERDWSDLDAKMAWLRSHPAEAEAIARRSWRLWRRYLSPAATNCYWRRLLETWGALLSFEPQFYKPGSDGPAGEWRGVPWESYALMQRMEWDAA